MNDDFLFQFRRDPPRRFVGYLRERLERIALSQTVFPRSTLRAFVLGLLVGGGALAGVWLWLDGASVDRSELPREQVRAAAPTSTPSAALIEKPPQTPVERSSPLPVGIEPRDPQPASAGPSKRSLHVIADATTHALVASVARMLKQYWGKAAPQVESLATSAAFARICSRLEEGPNIAITARRIRAEELQACVRAGRSVSEGALGRQALVLTAGRQSALMKLSPQDVYRALARELPARGQPGRTVSNPFRTWNSVNGALDFRPIEVIGPPIKSAQGQALVYLLMEAACDATPWVKALKMTDYEEYRRICHSIREDGAYVEAPQTAALVTRLWAEPYHVAVVDYSFYEQHRYELAPSLLSGVEPSPQTFESGEYAAVRMLYAYASAWHADRTAYLQELFGERALGLYGYLGDEGLMTLDERQRRAIYADVVMRGKRLESLQ